MRDMEKIRKLEILNRELELENNLLKEKQKENQKKIEELESQKRTLQEELDKIYYSRSYKIIQKIKKILKRG